MLQIQVLVVAPILTVHLLAVTRERQQESHREDENPRLQFPFSNFVNPTQEQSKSLAAGEKTKNTRFAMQPLFNFAHLRDKEQGPARIQHSERLRVRNRTVEGGEGWYYIAEGTWDLLGTDPLAPIFGVPVDGRIRLVAGGGFEPHLSIDNT